MIYQPEKKDWRVVDCVDDKCEIHVIPNNDDIEHEEDCTCWCNPTHDYQPTDGDVKVMVHHSADQREENE